MTTLLWIVRGWLALECLGFIIRLVRDDPRMNYGKTSTIEIRCGLLAAIVMFVFILWRLA